LPFQVILDGSFSPFSSSRSLSRSVEAYLEHLAILALDNYYAKGCYKSQSAIVTFNLKQIEINIRTYIYVREDRVVQQNR
jgi:hypothetical protein